MPGILCALCGLSVPPVACRFRDGRVPHAVIFLPGLHLVPRQRTWHRGCSPPPVSLHMSDFKAAIRALSEEPRLLDRRDSDDRRRHWRRTRRCSRSTTASCSTRSPSPILRRWSRSGRTTRSSISTRRPSRGRATRRFAIAGAVVRVGRHLRVRQLHAHRQRRSRTAERPARQRDVPADARHPAGARPQLHARTRICRTARPCASSATSCGRRASAAATTLVGETITLNGQPWQVVGIMPPRLSAAVRAGADLRAARLRGRRPDAGRRSRTAPATRSRSRG